MLKRLFPTLANWDGEKLMAAPMIALFWIGLIAMVVQEIRFAFGMARGE